MGVYVTESVTTEKSKVVQRQGGAPSIPPCPVSDDDN